MNGVHFNYTNAAPHGAHYRKERERGRDKKGTGKIGVGRRGDEKDRKIRNEGRGMQENEGMKRKPFEESSMGTAKGRTDVGIKLQLFTVKSTQNINITEQSIPAALLLLFEV